MTPFVAAENSTSVGDSRYSSRSVGLPVGSEDNQQGASGERVLDSSADGSSVPISLTELRTACDRIDKEDDCGETNQLSAKHTIGACQRTTSGTALLSPYPGDVVSTRARGWANSITASTSCLGGVPDEVNNQVTLTSSPPPPLLSPISEFSTTRLLTPGSPLSAVVAAGNPSIAAVSGTGSGSSISLANHANNFRIRLKSVGGARNDVLGLAGSSSNPSSVSGPTGNSWRSKYPGHHPYYAHPSSSSGVLAPKVSSDASKAALVRGGSASSLSSSSTASSNSSLSSLSTGDDAPASMSDISSASRPSLTSVQTSDLGDRMASERLQACDSPADNWTTSHFYLPRAAQHSREVSLTSDNDLKGQPVRPAATSLDNLLSQQQQRLMMAQNRQDMTNQSLPNSSEAQMKFIKDKLRSSVRSVIQDLNKYGVCVIDNFLGEEFGSQVKSEVHELHRTEQFKDGMLMGHERGTKESTIRSDKILWTDGNSQSTVYIKKLMQILDSIIMSANKVPGNGQLGNFRLRGRTRAMVACYPGNGTHYVKHIDNPNNDGRIVTAIYYINSDWKPETDGGSLRVYSSAMGGRAATIAPYFDRVVFFWSDCRNPHEVLPAFRNRYAVTLWYLKEKDEPTSQSG